MNYSAWKKKRVASQLELKRRMELRNEKIETLDEFAGHGFRYGGSSSAIGKMKQKLKEVRDFRAESSPC